MFIPLGTTRQVRKQAIVTESLILINALVYLIGLMGDHFEWFSIEAFTAGGWFHGTNSPIWTAISYQFLHNPDDVFHLIFNMLFLWIFGRAVEDRMGRLSFLGFYLVGGIVAGVGHAMVSGAPVIGASGSVAAVSGAFLALFPRSRIRILLIFFIIGIFEIPALWFIGFFFLMDILRGLGDIFGGSGHQIAYMAHLAGYVYGFAMAFVLLAIGLLRHDDFDMFYLFRQSRRRAAFRAASRGKASGLYESASADTAKRLEKQKQAAERRKPTPQDEAIARQRSVIAKAIAARDLPRAAREFIELQKLDPEAAIAEDAQLDVANQLYAEGRYEHAAKAYEGILNTYPGTSRGPEVRLMLGLIYTRQIERPERAKELLEAARKRLADGAQAQLAERLLAELQT
ncbi:MAG: rhomboid family intramembrane serine protease [Phycisphaerales bacterium]|nr:MAG: rhomboid family intramembrane serine protease [Phycisphaerales bacterium]